MADLSSWLPFIPPGVPGAPGTGGGCSTKEDFAQPAVGASISAYVGTSDAFTDGDLVAVAGGGYYTVVDAPDETHLVLLNMGGGANALEGNTIPAGAVISATLASAPTPVHAWDPRSFRCPWNGVDDDLPGLLRMLAAMPSATAHPNPIYVQLPPGQGYCSDDLRIGRAIRFIGHGRHYTRSDYPGNRIKFPPLRGLIFDGYDTSESYPAGGGADFAGLFNLEISSTQAVVTDQGGNIGQANYFLDTTSDTWTHLPQSAVLGTVVIRAGATVSSVQDYTNDGATRDTTHVVMFRCTTAGDKGATQPAGFATAGIAQLGTVITANGGGTARWTVESVPKDYINSTATASTYVPGQRVGVPGQPDHVFECMVGGDAKGWGTTIAAGSDGVTLSGTPQTIAVASSSAFFAAGGTARINSTTGFHVCTYTGVSAGNLTGVTGSGVIHTGYAVTAPFNYPEIGIACRVPGEMLAPAYRAIFYDRRCLITAGSDGQALSGSPQTVNVDDTTDMASSGTAQVRLTSGAFTPMVYSGKTPTTLTGCTGAGTLATDNVVGQGVKWKHIPSQCVTILANWVTIEGCALSGATGTAVWIQANGDPASANGSFYVGGSNFWAIRECLFQWSGSSISTNSNNTNGGEAANIDHIFLGAGRTQVDGAAYLNVSGGHWGHGGGGIKDRTQGTNMWRRHYLQFSMGVPYRNDLLSNSNGNNSLFEDVIAEADLPSRILYPATVLGICPLDTTSNATVIDGTNCYNIRALSKSRADTSKSISITLGANTANGACNPFLMRHNADSYAVGFGDSNDLTSSPANWLTFGKAESTGFFDAQVFAFTRPGVSLWPSGAALTNPAPLWVTQPEIFIGNLYDGDPRGVGFSSAAPATGWHKRGSVRFNTGATVGSPIGWQCTVDGTPGTWVAMANL